MYIIHGHGFFALMLIYQSNDDFFDPFDNLASFLNIQDQGQRMYFLVNAASPKPLDLFRCNA